MLISAFSNAFYAQTYGANYVVVIAFLVVWAVCWFWLNRLGNIMRGDY